MNSDNLKARTIADFGEQWTRYKGDNQGYYGNLELFEDIAKPFILPSEIEGKRVAEIGSGTGRIVSMLAAARPVEIIAIEPSEAIEVLKQNTKEISNLIRYIRADGESIGEFKEIDFIFSIGVLHHIPDPVPVVRQAFNALRLDGKLLIWVYGYEGNELYIFLTMILRKLTIHLSDGALGLFSFFLAIPLWIYIRAAHFFPCPMRRYMKNVLARLSFSQLRLNVYDQLNPTYAKYYRKQEVQELMANAGFTSITLHHRHGYSWTAIATK